MKYDIERLEADYIEAKDAWEAACAAEPADPMSKLERRRYRDHGGILSARMHDLKDALTSLHDGFPKGDLRSSPWNQAQIQRLLKDYEVAE